MENPDTLILNLTFLGTVGMAFLMFLVLFLLGVITLVLAGIGRLAAVALMALFGRRSRDESVPLVRLGGPFNAGPDGGTSVSAAGPAGGGVPAVVRHLALTAARREPPVLAEQWASAVAEADARAVARARAAAPDIKLSVRDLPDPRVPADKVVEVAPLVESALDTHGAGRVPRSFEKTQAPRPLSPLDTGSLVSLSGPVQAVKGASSKNSSARGTGADRPAPSGNPPKGRQPLP